MRLIILLVPLLLAVTARAAESFRIDPSHTFVGFSVSHLGHGKATGRFTDVQGTIVVDEKAPSVDVTIRAASIDTGNANRDEHLRGADFFDVAKYPEITFRSTRVEKNVAHGKLTMHGVTKDVAMPFTVTGPFPDPLPAGEKRMHVSASLVVDRRDYGIRWSRVMDTGGLFIGNEVTVDINVEAYLPKKKAEILERAPYAFAAYEELPAWARAIYTAAEYERIRQGLDAQLTRIRYRSDDVPVVGFIYRPTADGRWPLVIWNRGGVGPGAAIGFADVEEMYRFATSGFVVVASDYREADEVGGADLHDVLNLASLARELAYVDGERVFLSGVSRGGMMALQAMRAGLPVRAAVIVGAPLDWESAFVTNPNLRELARTRWPDYERRAEEHLERRSALRWAESINAPLLIVHGGADRAVSPLQALAFARKLTELGKPYDLVIYANDDHRVTAHRDERIRRAIGLFHATLRTAPA